MSNNEIDMKAFAKLQVYTPIAIGDRGKVNWEAALDWVRKHPANADAIWAKIEQNFLVEKNETVQRSSIVRKLDNEAKKGNLGKAIAVVTHPDTGRKITAAFYGPPSKDAKDIRPELKKEKVVRQLQEIGAEEYVPMSEHKSIPVVNVKATVDAGGKTKKKR